MEDKAKRNLIVILGPTASGKSSVAVRLAAELKSEIISADSRQVYRGMDIGTGKDLAGYVVEGKKIPCHLIDIVDPAYEFNLFEYQKRFHEVFESLADRAVLPIMAGGTGLYIDAVLRGYGLTEVPESEALREELDLKSDFEIARRLRKLNPKLHNSTDLNERSRIIRALEIALFERDCAKYDKPVPEIRPLVIGIRWDRQVLRERITRRLKERLDAGLIEEVERLHKEGIGWAKLDFFGLEYRYVGQYLQGKLDYNDMFQKLNSAIHQFAKRQDTWFRRMERKGVEINWIDDADYGKVRALVLNELSAGD